MYNVGECTRSYKTDFNGKIDIFYNYLGWSGTANIKLEKESNLIQAAT